MRRHIIRPEICSIESQLASPNAMTVAAPLNAIRTTVVADVSRFSTARRSNTPPIVAKTSEIASSTKSTSGSACPSSG